MGAENLDDTEDMKKVLIHFKMSGSMNKLTLTKGVSMKDVKEKAGGGLQGFNYILTGIARDHPECKQSLGESPEQRALIQQWLQYAVLLRGKSPIQPELLKEINSSLALTTFVAGHVMTLADPVLFLSLYPTYLDLNFYEKEKYPHLSRWFRLMQSYEDLRSGHKKIIFSKNLLYNSIGAHP